eukprot:TRINITY_DN1958_c0_g2_i1.p1 TRINITY_DN1958_c0_g2~~TRINITY_DN1958_c0_g2_i1.p1  ORF type:complete len:648 (-),score=144.87 TRINITY_DN1958_c0_g2_i1:485-2377(-)
MARKTKARCLLLAAVLVYALPNWSTFAGQHASPWAPAPRSSSSPLERLSLPPLESCAKRQTQRPVVARRASQVDLPDQMEDWTNEHVLHWVVTVMTEGRDEDLEETRAIFEAQRMRGKELKELTIPLMRAEGVKLGPAMLLYKEIQALSQQSVQSDVPENVKAFARALDDAELEGQILKTETGSFKLQNVSEIWDEEQFYVRDCYTEIADIMLKKKNPVMSLLGSSGIGKSNFMVYLIWRRFQDSELKDFPVFLHQRDDIFRFKKGEEPKKVDVRTLKSTLQQALYIMDADIDVEHGVFCQSLWITSARRPETAAFNTEHFKKAERFSGQFFMPPWTLTEMLSAEVMALHKLNEEVVKERFGIFGGTARLVLERDETRTVVDRRRLVEAVQSADALQCLKVSSDMKAISKTTHLLVKMMPWSNFSWFDVQLSSPYVRQELVKQNRQDNSDELWKRMWEGMITGIGFALFEEEFHQFMQDKSIGKFKLRARCLTADGKGSDTTQELQGGLEGVLISGNPAADIKDSEYYQPQGKNFPAFDSWTSQGVFQLTIADAHDITFNDSGKAMDVTKTQAYKIVDALCKKHDSKAKFFFVVPQFQFDKWKTVQTVKQPEMAEKIEQWVACFEQNLPK